MKFIDELVDWGVMVLVATSLGVGFYLAIHVLG